jgi:hypothetical protein
LLLVIDAATGCIELLQSLDNSISFLYIFFTNFNSATELTTSHKLYLINRYAIKRHTHTYIPFDWK